MFEAKIQSIITKLNAALDDARKVDAGKSGTPGTRLRKLTIEVQADLKHIREQVTAVRKTAEG